MRTAISNIIFFILPIFTFGQGEIIDYPKDTIFASGYTENYETVGYAYLINLGPDTINISWKRKEINFKDDWTSSVCDAYSCFPDYQDSSVFQFYPFDTSRMDIHLFPVGVAGEGIVELSVSLLENPSEILCRLVYIFNVDSVTKTASISELKPSIFPNPFIDRFYINSGTVFEKISLINTSGELIKNLQKSDQYFINDLPAGQYYIVGKNEQNQLSFVTPIIKL